jgi:hypothetical protein
MPIERDDIGPISYSTGRESGLLMNSATSLVAA